jgi:hypothetical protein
MVTGPQKAPKNFGRIALAIFPSKKENITAILQIVFN